MVVELPGGGILIYNANQVFIPSVLRNYVLLILQKYYFSANDMSSMAAAFVFWQNMKRMFSQSLSLVKYVWKCNKKR